MVVPKCCRLPVAVLLMALAIPVAAQTTASSGTVLIIPLAAETSTFSTEVTVRNFNPVAITVKVTFYEANTSSTPGKHVCTDLGLPANQTQQFRVGTQCPVTVASHHGFILLEDGAAQKVNAFSAFARTDNFAGSGFTVESFPIGTFSGAVAGSLGLKRLAAQAGPPPRPAYQTNCFVGSLGETLNYRITLREGVADTQIGNNIDGTLGPYEMVRYLDIFNVAGLPPGDYSNVRARFDDNAAGEPAYIGFCTVQENTNFSADFRIARSTDGMDNSQLRSLCYGQNPCGTIDPAGPVQILDAANKLIHQTFIRAPDFIKCSLMGPRVADLEMRIRGPGDPFLSPVWPSTGAFSSGGNNQTSFYIDTGPRGGVNGGQATRWYIDVGFREGGTATFPIDYGIDCTSGNGMMIPWARSRTTDDF